jgi:hypothetical protein
MNAAWHRTHEMPRPATSDERLAWHLAHEQQCACRPMPAPLEALDAEQTRARLRRLLDGRDSRSLAQSAAARTLIEARPARIAVLAALAGHANWVVAMRAFDLLEKIARAHPAWVQPHRAVLLTAATHDQWLIRLQAVRGLPLLTWTPRERAEVVGALRANVRSAHLFVRAWSLDGLATLALGQRSLLPEVRRWLGVFERSPSAALRARARHIRARLNRGSRALPTVPRRATGRAKPREEGPGPRGGPRPARTTKASA